jgi:hypothetical protein
VKEGEKRTDAAGVVAFAKKECTVCPPTADTLETRGRSRCGGVRELADEEVCVWRRGRVHAPKMLRKNKIQNINKK